MSKITRLVRLLRLGCGAVLCALGLAPVQAALVQGTTPSTTTWLDTQLSGAALVYDANFYSATEGRLVVLASGNSLRGPGVPASPATPPGQIYLGGTDTLRDPMITLRINNQTGALVSGTVSVTASNDGGPNDSWSFLGTVTSFGFAAKNGTSTLNTFDAQFTVNSYNYADVVQGLVGTGGVYPNAPTTCASSDPWCGMGYLRINADGVPYVGGDGTAVNFNTDWVRGSGVISGSTPNAQLGTTTSGIAAAAFSNTAVSSDIFTTVPLPPALLLMASGLLAGVPAWRRRQATA